MITLDARSMTPEAIQQAGLAALLERLGRVGMIRFLQQFEPGRGDHSQERHAALDHLDLVTILGWIAQRRAAKDAPPPPEAPGS